MMPKFPANTQLVTNGLGLWSRENKIVDVTGYNLFTVDDHCEFGELRVYFDPKTWNVEEDGLIYTDPLFLGLLRESLNRLGLDADDVDYSEQGMQGDDFVSLDVGKDFIDSWYGAGNSFGVREEELYND